MEAMMGRWRERKEFIAQFNRDLEDAWRPLCDEINRAFPDWSVLPGTDVEVTPKQHNHVLRRGGEWGFCNIDLSIDMMLPREHGPIRNPRPGESVSYSHMLYLSANSPFLLMLPARRQCVAKGLKQAVFAKNLVDLLHALNETPSALGAHPESLKIFLDDSREPEVQEARESLDKLPALRGRLYPGPPKFIPFANEAERADARRMALEIFPHKRRR